MQNHLVQLTPEEYNEYLFLLEQRELHDSAVKFGFFVALAACIATFS